jgi:hypothetical protein
MGHSAVREALVGNMDAAKQDAKVSTLRSDSRQGNAFSAIALALAGDSAQAARISDDLRKNFPADTIVQYDDLPMIRAATALHSGDASRAVEALAEAEPYELGQTNYSFTFAFWTTTAWSGTSRLARSRISALLVPTPCRVTFLKPAPLTASS